MHRLQWLQRCWKDCWNVIEIPNISHKKSQYCNDKNSDNNIPCHRSVSQLETSSWVITDGGPKLPLTSDFTLRLSDKSIKGRGGTFTASFSTKSGSIAFPVLLTLSWRKTVWALGELVRAVNVVKIISEEAIAKMPFKAMEFFILNANGDSCVANRQPSMKLHWKL